MQKLTINMLFSLLMMICSITPVWGAFDINTASASEIQENMDGVGEKKANAIVEYRKKHGKISSIDELANVPGIGEKTIEKNRDKLRGKELAKTKGKGKKIGLTKAEKQKQNAAADLEKTKQKTKSSKQKKDKKEKKLSKNSSMDSKSKSSKSLLSKSKSKSKSEKAAAKKNVAYKGKKEKSKK